MYTVEDLPKNPLYDKWIQQYPPTSRPEFSQVCDGYSCMWCGRCPRGDCWKCPDTDVEEYEAYQEQILEFFNQHPEALDEISVTINIEEE